MLYMFHHRELKTVYTASGTLSNLYCYLPLSWKRWKSRGRVLSLPRQWQVAVKVWQSTRCCIYSFWTPDDGWRNHLKHVEHFTEINKLCNVASCWLYLKIGTVYIRTLYHCCRGACLSCTLKAEVSPERFKSLTGLRTALFWVITQRVVVVPYRNFGTTYRSHFQGHPLKMGPIVCPETSARKYQYSLRNNPEEYSSHPPRGSSMQSYLRTVRCWVVSFPLCMLNVR